MNSDTWLGSGYDLVGWMVILWACCFVFGLDVSCAGLSFMGGYVVWFVLVGWLRLASGLGCRACVFGFLVYGLVWAGIVASWFAGFAYFAVCCVCCGLGCFVGLCFAGCCVYAWIFGLVFCVVVLVGLEVWVGCGLCLAVVGIGI